MTSEQGERAFKAIMARMPPKVEVDPVLFETVEDLKTQVTTCKLAAHQIFTHDDPARLTSGSVCKTCRSYWHVHIGVFRTRAK